MKWNKICHGAQRALLQMAWKCESGLQSAPSHQRYQQRQQIRAVRVCGFTCDFRAIKWGIVHFCGTLVYSWLLRTLNGSSWLFHFALFHLYHTSPPRGKESCLQKSLLLSSSVTNWILLRRHTEGNIVIYRKRKWRLGTHSCACPIFLMLMWHNRSHLQHQANKQTLWLRSGMISRLYSVFCWTGCCLKVIISCRLRITVSFKTAENNDFQIRPAWFFFSYWISLWVYYWLTEWSASIKSLLLCVKCLSGCSLCIKATL